MTQTTKTEQNEALEHLHDILKPGDVIFTVLRHTSRSGMYRAIDLYKMVDNDPHRITYFAAKAMRAKYDKKYEAIGVSGCGMDMGFSLVYDLGYCLFRNGFTLAPSQHGRNGDTSGFDNDGGYALIQRWL